MADFKPMLTPSEMTDFAIDAATAKATSRQIKSFMLALNAGAFIGLGYIFFLVSQQGSEGMPLGMAKVVGGIVFSSGLALVVVTGAELFTSSTLTLTARATGRITWVQLLRNWAVVYLGNFLGALTLVTLMFFAGTYEGTNGALGAAALKLANYKTSHTLIEAFCLGILCNMMVCLAVWLTYAGRTVADKIIALTLPIAMFVASGFEHSVANMFLLPYALCVKTFAPQSFWDASGLQASQFPHVNWTEVWTDNLIPVSLGNIVGGGIMIGLFYVVVHKKLGINPHQG